MTSHGTARKYQYGCRCEPCRAAKIAANRKYLDRKYERRGKPPNMTADKTAWMRLYRSMLKRGEWEQGVHRRKVTILRKHAVIAKIGAKVHTSSV